MHPRRTPALARREITRAAAFAPALLLAASCAEDPDPPGEGADVEPPVVTITEPADGSSVGCATVTVRGTASDPSGVASVVVDGTPATDLGGGFATWEATIPLSTGANSVSVSATDAVGNAGDGLATVTVDAVDATALSLDLTSARLYGTVTLDGEELFSAEGAYYITLRDPETGLDSEVGFYATNPNWQIETLQGAYDVLIEPDEDLIATSSDLVVPVRVAQSLDVGVDTRLDIPLERAEVHGSVSVDGAPILGENGSGYSIGLVEPGQAPRRFLSVPGTEPEFTLRTIAGTYDVWFTFQYGFFGPSSPEMRLVAARSVAIGPSHDLDLDLRLATVEGDLGIDGGPLSGGYLTFAELDSGQSFTFTVSGTSYSFQVPEGRYHVSMIMSEEVLGGSFYSEYHPVGSAVLAEDVSVAGSARFDFVRDTTTVTGTLTLDGSSLPSPPKSWFTVRLYDAAAMTSVQADYRSNGGYFTLTTFEGEFDVWVTLPATSLDAGLLEAILPVRVETGLVVDGSGADVYQDIASATLSGSVSLGGVPLASSPGHTWRLELYDTADPSRYAATTFDASASEYSVRAYPGAYDARVVVDEFLLAGDVGALVRPRDIGRIDVPAQGGALDLDIARAAVGGTVSLDGVPLAGNPSWTYLIGVTDPALGDAPDDRAEVGFAANLPDFSAETLAGTYDLWLTLPEDLLGSGSASIPRRVRAGLVLCGE